MKINWNMFHPGSIVLWALLFSPVIVTPLLRAQNTATLTGTVTDSSAQIWASATWVANINVPSGGTPMWISGGAVPRSYTGQLDSTGTFVSGSVVGRNSQIVPAGTTWTFTMFSLTSSAPSIVGPLTITGTTYAAGAVISPAISPPIVTSSNLSYAYAPGEVINPVNGNGYVNTISKSLFLYNNGWVAMGGGCTGSSVTGNVAFNNQVGQFQSGCLASVGSPFSASISCTAAGSFEIGFVTTSPNTCTFGYSNGTAASGTLTDGTNTTTLTTPYTSGALAFTYSSNTTFTLHATATNSQTTSPSTSATFTPRVFAGVGTSGATGATASGTTAVLVGATGTLPSAGLGDQGSYGPFTPSNQSIYLILTQGSCTFTSGGFNFPMNTPTAITFVNQYGTSVSEFLYQSTNLLSATFTLVPTC